MSAEIISIAPNQPADGLSCHERLARMSALLTAIDAGELLSALPDCPIARADHAAALSLITMIEFDIRALREQLPTGL